MSREKWEREIEELKAQIPVAEQARRDAPSYYYDGNIDERMKRLAECRRLENVVTSLRNRIKYRQNKIAELDAPPDEVLKDVFGQVFEPGQMVAWSSSSKYAGAYLGWVVKVTRKMVSVSNAYGSLKSLPPFDPDAYGTSLMPKALIVVDAIVEKVHE